MHAIKRQLHSRVAPNLTKLGNEAWTGAVVTLFSCRTFPWRKEDLGPYSSILDDLAAGFFHQAGG